MLKHYLPRTLFGRALLIIVTPVVALQIVATVIFYERHWDTVTRRLALGLAGDAALIIEMIQTTQTEHTFNLISESAERNMSLRLNFIPNDTLPNHPSEVHFVNRIVDRTLVEAFAALVKKPFRIDTSSFKNDIEIRLQLDGGVLYILTDRKRVSSSTTYIFIMWMVGSSLVLLTVAILFLRNQIRPIRRLAHAADEFGKGRDALFFRPSGATEVRQAAAAFISMRERIQRQISQRTEMLAGVSHDLRTPLTRIKLQLAMLDNTQAVQYLRADVSEMERMVEGYLAFMRGQDAELAEKTNIVRLLQKTVSDGGRHGHNITYQGLTSSCKKNFRELECEFTLTIKPNAIKRCLTNLLDNAARHATRVEVSLMLEEDQIEIYIDDNGPGIPIEKRNEVFRPFYRLDESRNPETGGIGLGLSIARDIARAHGGDIILSAGCLDGLRATVRLPI